MNDTEMIMQFRCAYCGKITSGRLKLGSWQNAIMLPRRHDHNNMPCPGNSTEAEKIEVPLENTKTQKGKARKRMLNAEKAMQNNS